MKNELMRLRLKVIKALDDLIEEKSIKSTEDKISCYTDRGVLMSPENIQNTITLIDQAREVNNTINNFGRSVIKEKNNLEEKNEQETEKMLNHFGRSICTSEDTTAYDRVQKIKDSKNKKNKKNSFIIIMKELEDYMKKNEISHSFRCKNKKLSKKNIDEMIKNVNELELEDEFEKIKVLRNINKMKSQSLFDFCDKKPYQCLICPYYYANLLEYSEIIRIKNKEHNNE